MQFRQFGKRNRTVLDTNILVSGLLNPTGPPSRILQLLVTGVYELILSEEIFQEYESVLNQFSQIDSHARKALLRKIRQYAVTVRPTLKLAVVKNDPEDNKFLECAVSGRARYLVSGDSHLLILKKFRSVQILKAAEYLLMLDPFILGGRRKR